MEGHTFKICKRCGQEFLGGVGWYTGICPDCNQKRGNR